MTVISPVALSYVWSYLVGLHNGKYCVGLVVNLPVVLRLLFLDFLAIHDTIWQMIKMLVCDPKGIDNIVKKNKFMRLPSTSKI